MAGSAAVSLSWPIADLAIVMVLGEAVSFDCWMAHRRLPLDVGIEEIRDREGRGNVAAFQEIQLQAGPSTDGTSGAKQRSQPVEQAMGDAHGRGSVRGHGGANVTRVDVKTQTRKRHDISATAMSVPEIAALSRRPCYAIIVEEKRTLKQIYVCRNQTAVGSCIENAAHKSIMASRRDRDSAVCGRGQGSVHTGYFPRLPSPRW